MTASYYHREVISSRYVDHVLRGDSAEQPDRMGHRLFARTLEEHRRPMRESDLRDLLKFETGTMFRAEAVDVAADAMEQMIGARKRCGLLKASGRRRSGRR